MSDDDGIVVGMHWVYILRCGDDALYIGETNDVPARLIAHNQGRSPHTASRRPVTLAYSEVFDNRTLALEREQQLKRWTRAKKEALISGDLAALKRLYTSRLAPARNAK